MCCLPARAGGQQWGRVHEEGEEEEEEAEEVGKEGAAKGKEENINAQSMYHASYI